jgi:hypothetical protein
VARLSYALGLRPKLSGEATDLSRLIEHRLAHGVSGEDEEAVDQLEIQTAYLRHRFVDSLTSYETGDRFYGYLDTVLNFTSIVAGLGASMSAALNASKIWPITLGLVVGFLQSLSQWLKPSQRAARKGIAASDLRSEAWSLLQSRDRYKGKSFETAWALFCDQVEKVEDREEAAEDKGAGHAEAQDGAAN